MRRTAASLLLLAILTCACTGAYASGDAVTADGADVKALRDGSVRTHWTASDASVTLRIDGAEPFDGVYVQWLTPPEALSVECYGAPGRAVFCPADGGELYNQYIRLPFAADAVVLRDEAPLAVCGAQAVRGPSGGEERWLPPARDADILIVAAHPDDDLLYFGGTLPLYSAERGLKVQTVFMTAPSRLRKHEALAGQWAAGGRYHPVFGAFPDRLTHTAAECARQWGREEALAFIVEQLRRLKPRVVLTHDLDGEYGHGAHMLTAELLTEAVTLAGDGDAFPLSAERWGTHEVSKLYLHLYKENAVEMDWSVALNAFGGARAIDVARAAFLRHESQQGYGLDVRDRGLYSSTRFGLYYTRVGYDAQGGDFLENIPIKR